MVTEIILDKLGVFYDDLAKEKHGSSPSITYGDLVSRIVADRGLVPCKTTFSEISEQTFNRMMRRIFPKVRLNGGKETWFYHILSIIEHKYCGNCNSIKPYSSYHKDTSRSNKITSWCADCRNKNQEGGYTKYLDSHKKSYTKNKGKIRQRSSIAKLERAKRIVPWTEHKEISEMYQNCPEGYHIDHILPLCGKDVSGLHVLANLQYLPASENLSKGNKYLQFS